MTDPVLHLENVVVRVANRTLLDAASLTVSAGQSVALIGPNGAGKTTLLHAAALLRFPDSGAVRIRGQAASPANAAELRRSLSVVFQDPLLFDTRILANAAAGLRFRGIARTEAEARARSWLQRFGVDHLAERGARGLSGGEASRVALSRAFATDPALLLLDEPFGALDAPSRAALLPALRNRLQETGAASVLVTHGLQEAAAFSERLVVMASGRIVAAGRASELIARPPTRQAAELLGIENVLRGEIVGSDGLYACVALLPSGPILRVALGANQTDLPDRVVTVTLPAGSVRALRPHEPAPPAWNRLPGIVRDVQWLASGNRMQIETPAPLTALAPCDPTSGSWETGDPVVATFAPEAAHLIPERHAA